MEKNKHHLDNQNFEQDTLAEWDFGLLENSFTPCVGRENTWKLRCHKVKTVVVISLKSMRENV